MECMSTIWQYFYFFIVDGTIFAWHSATFTAIHVGDKYSWILSHWLQCSLELITYFTSFRLKWPDVSVKVITQTVLQPTRNEAARYISSLPACFPPLKPCCWRVGEGRFKRYQDEPVPQVPQTVLLLSWQSAGFSGAGFNVIWAVLSLWNDWRSA